MKSKKVFHDGKIHVNSEMCATCIFRPGNPMHLNPGRLQDIVTNALKSDTAIVCHDTYAGNGVTDQQAVCRGFFDRYETTPLQVATRLDRITFVTPCSQP